MARILLLKIKEKDKSNRQTKVCFVYVLSWGRGNDPKLELDSGGNIDFAVLTEDAKRGINIINKREDARIEGDHQKVSGLSGGE